MERAVEQPGGGFGTGFAGRERDMLAGVGLVEQAVEKNRAEDSERVSLRGSGTCLLESDLWSGPSNNRTEDSERISLGGSGTGLL